ncbi:MAG: hypothetical protein AVDCRST_MAG68-3469, partial [uncultured Gemmatimonadetes bacterium]
DPSVSAAPAAATDPPGRPARRAGARHGAPPAGRAGGHRARGHGAAALPHLAAGRLPALPGAPWLGAVRDRRAGARHRLLRAGGGEPVDGAQVAAQAEPGVRPGRCAAPHRPPRGGAHQRPRARPPQPAGGLDRALRVLALLLRRRRLRGRAPARLRRAGGQRAGSGGRRAGAGKRPRGPPPV